MELYQNIDTSSIMRLLKKLHNSILFPSIFLLFCLSGCNKESEISNNNIKNGTLSATMKSGVWSAPASGADLKLGLTIDSPNSDLGCYTLFNLPYTLKDGILIPEVDFATPPDGYSSARLCVYGPYTTEGFYLQRDREYNLILINFPFGVETDQRTKGIASSDLVWGEIADFRGKGNSYNVALKHQLCKIKINLTSELGNDLSDADVTLAGMRTSGSLKFATGGLDFSGNYETQDITAFRNPDGSYEVIVPPQEIRNAVDYIRVNVGGVNYTYRSVDVKKLVSGMEYTFDIKVKDSGTLPFAINVTYDGGKTLGEKLAVGARETTYPITMKEIPLSGGSVSFTYLKLRNASGERSWVKLWNTNSITKDVIYDGVSYLQIIFEENLSPEPRSMVLEFYNTNDSKFVHKRVLIEQAGATDYLNLSTSSLSVDKMGNIYDFPQKLSVLSSNNWTLENSAPDWVTVQGYSPGNRNQGLSVTVKENNTGAERKAELRFMVNGTTLKTFPIVQSSTESSTFTLKYDLNLHYNTKHDSFRTTSGLLGEYYVGHVTIFAKFEPNGDTAAEIDNESTYGFVVDAPASANKMVVNNFSSEYFICPNYSGQAKSVTGINSSILGSSTKGKQNFYRQLMFDLNFPANVKRNQKVKCTVEINNIVGTGAHDLATVTYEIINQ